MALTLWPLKEELSPGLKQPLFHYEFKGKELREGDIVDGTWRNQFIYEAMVCVIWIIELKLERAARTCS